MFATALFLLFSARNVSCRKSACLPPERPRNSSPDGTSIRMCRHVLFQLSPSHARRTNHWGSRRRSPRSIRHLADLASKPGTHILDLARRQAQPLTQMQQRSRRYVQQYGGNQYPNPTPMPYNTTYGAPEPCTRRHTLISAIRFLCLAFVRRM